MQAVHDDLRTAAAPADRHLLRVARYLRFLGCPASAVDDLVQEAALAGLRRWPDGSAPLPFLLATAANQLRKLLRDRGRRRELADVDRLDTMWQEHVADHGDGAAERLRTCLERLPPRSREALRLRYGEDQPLDAIAARLGLGFEGVKSLLARLRATLAACVGGRREGD